MKIIFIGILVFSFFVQAQTSNQPIKTKIISDTGYQEEIQERAKRRTYAGGQDETDVKVQVQVLSPTRKVAPVVEDTSEPASDD